MTSSLPFRIYCAYSWDVKKSRSARAIKELFARINGIIEQFYNKESGLRINLFYNRLRSTSGTFVFNSIRQRICGADAVIFDITRLNPNVMIELGIALEMHFSNKSQCKIFLI